MNGSQEEEAEETLAGSWTFYQDMCLIVSKWNTVREVVIIIIIIVIYFIFLPEVVCKVEEPIVDKLRRFA